MICELNFACKYDGTDEGFHFALLMPLKNHQPPNCAALKRTYTFSFVRNVYFYNVIMTEKAIIFDVGSFDPSCVQIREKCITLKLIESNAQRSALT